MKIINLSLLVLCLFNLGCPFYSKSPKKFTNQNWKYDINLDDHLKLLVVSTNNIEDEIYPYNSIYRKTGTPIKFDVGGVEIMSGYLKIARKRYVDSTILVDAGHLYSNKDRKDLKFSTTNVLNKLSYDAILLTSREITEVDKFDGLVDHVNKMDLPFVNSNILDVKTNKPFSKIRSLPYKIIERQGVKIGIVGVTDFNSIKDKKEIKGLYFEDPVLAFLKVKENFKKENVDITILLANISTKCDQSLAHLEKSGNEREKFQLNCSKEPGVYQLIKRLPPKSVDLVVASDTNFSEGFVGEIPVLQNPGKGQFISMYEIHFDKKKKRIILDKSHIKAPTMLCHSFLEITEDCFSMDEIEKSVTKGFSSQTSFEFSEATFLGQKVIRDLTLKSSLLPINR